MPYRQFVEDVRVPKCEICDHQMAVQQEVHDLIGNDAGLSDLVSSYPSEPETLNDWGDQLCESAVGMIADLAFWASDGRDHEACSRSLRIHASNLHS